MVAPFDFTKLRKERNKRLGLRSGFDDPITWINTGNYALNKMISGHFDRGVPLGAVTVFAGESGCLPAEAKVVARLREDATAAPDKSFSTSVAHLREMFAGREGVVEIDTPDGFQPITAWFNKGTLPLVIVVAENGYVSRCATNHLLQRTDGEWVPAGDVVQGDELLTADGPSIVATVSDAGSAECFDFEIGHPNHRYWGDGISSHNSGKSYIVSGNIVRDALKQGCYVVLLDSEDALKRTWMNNLGVDVDHPNLTKEVVSTVDEIADCINEYAKFYVESYKETPREEQPKVLFVVDSLGVVQTKAEIEQFERGELKGDKGIKAKMLKMLVANCLRLFSGYQIGLVATNHTYKSQDMYNPDDVISGGSGFVFASSIIVSMNKKKLKAEEAVAADGGKKDGKKKPKEIIGIISKVKCVKSRYSKPFEEVEIQIPYETGMDPYSGLFDMFESKGVFTKSGSWYSYIDKSGNEHKQYRKDIGPPLYDLIIREWDDGSRAVAVDDASESEGALPDEEETSIE